MAAKGRKSSGRKASKRGGGRSRSAARKTSGKRGTARGAGGMRGRSGRSAARRAGAKRSTAKRSRSAKRGSTRKAAGSRRGSSARKQSPVARVKRVTREVVQQAQGAVSAGVETLKDFGENLVDRVRSSD